MIVYIQFYIQALFGCFIDWSLYLVLQVVLMCGWVNVSMKGRVVVSKCHVVLSKCQVVVS